MKAVVSRVDRARVTVAGDTVGEIGEAVVSALRGRGARVETGRFGADMSVESVAEGPFTVLVEV